MADYKVHGSISVNQITPQRKWDDSYFGELVLRNMRTGENVAQNVRDDIFEGNTAKMRRFKKRGTKYGYTARLNFPASVPIDELKQFIKDDTGRTVSSLLNTQYNDILLTQLEFARYSMTRNLYLENLYGSMGGMEEWGTNKLIDRFAKSDTAGTGTWMVAFYYTDASWEETTIPWDVSYSGGKHPGFYTQYVSGGRTYYFYSADPKYHRSSGASEETDIYPIISLQDDGNFEFPYESCFGPEHQENINRAKPLKGYGIDWEPLSRQIFGFIPDYGSLEWNQTYQRKWAGSAKLKRKFNTSLKYHADLSAEVDVPGFGTDKWKKSYAKTYNNLMKACSTSGATQEQLEFCVDNPTEWEYYVGLIKDKEEAKDNSANITDVHIGVFASAKKLDQESALALLYTMKPILPKMQPDVDGYHMSLVAGSLKIVYHFKEWSLCRRYGVANPIRYPPGVKNPKIKHADFTIEDQYFPDFKVGDNYDEIDTTYGEMREPNPIVDPNSGPTQAQIDNMEDGYVIVDETAEPTGYIELRVQVEKDDKDRPRFLEMRLIGPTAQHLVNVQRDGEHGKSGSVVLVGGLGGFYSADADKPYSDVLVYPISYAASREVRFFRRERFRRECTMVIIGAIKMEKIKWYQTGLFKVVMIIGALALSFFFPPAGMTGLAAVASSAAMMAVLFVVSSLVDNPWLKAILSVALAVMVGYIDTNSIVDVLSNPALWIEASGTMVTAYIADEMIKLQEEMKEFREMVNRKQKELDEMQKEVGMDDYNADWMRYVASLAPVESPQTFHERALKTDVFESELSVGVDGSNNLPAPQE